MCDENNWAWKLKNSSKRNYTVPEVDEALVILPEETSRSEIRRSRRCEFESTARNSNNWYKNTFLIYCDEGFKHWIALLCYLWTMKIIIVRLEDKYQEKKVNTF